MGVPVFVVNVKSSSLVPPIPVIKTTKSFTGELKLYLYEKGPEFPKKL